MGQQDARYLLARFIALIAVLSIMMSVAPFLVVFGGLAIGAGVIIAYALRKRVVQVQSVIPRDLLPTPDEIEAVVTRYRDEIEKFWHDWKTHH